MARDFRLHSRRMSQRHLRSCTQQEPEALISRYQVEPGNEGLEASPRYCCNSCKISVTQLSEVIYTNTALRSPLAERALCA